jgi:sulfatase modifying factor 1
MTWLPGGVFTMGSERFYPEEAPRRRVLLDGFWIDTVPVTNLQFAAFA